MQSLPGRTSSEPKLVWGVLFSAVFHIVLILVLVGVPSLSSPERTYFSSTAYRVKLVDAPRSIPGKAKGSQGKKAVGTAKKMVVSEPPKTKKKKPAPQKKTTQKKTAQKKGTTVTVKDTPKKGTTVKSPAKKSQQVDSDGAFSLALNKIKKKVDEQRMQEEVERIREKIADGENGEGASDSSAAVGSGGIPSGQGKMAELPLNYRLYYQAIEEKIKGNWNLALPRGVIEDMSAMEVILSITIKSDGHITDVSFEKKSGNVYLDESAFRSIKKSSPLPPFSEYNIREPFFETGIIFPVGELL